MQNASRNHPLPVLVIALAAWQLAQGWRGQASEFEKSYWLVTYEHGFVRRGLGGEVLRWLPGPVTPELVLGAALAVSVVSALALLVVVIALLRRGEGPARWLALMLAASPFTLEAALNKHRPDQLGLVVLAVVAVCGARRWVLISTSVLLAVLVLVHEGALVSYGLFVLPLLVRTGSRGEWLRAGAFFAPSAVTTGLVLLQGRATPDQVQALVHSPQTSAVLTRPTDTDYSVLPYLSDSLTHSFAVVAAFPVEKAVLMVLWGALLAGVHAMWLAWARVALSSLWITWLPALAAFGFLHLTAVDWQRWMAAAFTAVLVVASGMIPARSVQPPPRRPAGTWLWVLVAIYLATRAPAGSVGWRDGWVGFLGYWTWPF